MGSFDSPLSPPRDAALPAESPSPRAFAVGTGVVFQYAGFLLLLGSIAVWVFSAWFVPPQPRPAGQWSEFLRGDRLPTALLTISMLTTFVGAIALMAVGVGLQGERPKSGVAAMMVCGLTALVHIAVAILLIVAAHRFLWAIIPGFLATLSMVLFVLGAGSASALRRFPPPADLNAATPEFLEEHRRKRLERLQKYDA